MIENHKYSAEAFKKQPATDQAASRLSRINRSAIDIFAKEGYDAASVEHVATASGILKGSLYHYMTSKEDLLYHLVARINEEAIDIANSVLGTDASISEKLFDFAKEYTRYNAEKSVEVSIYYRSWHQLSAERHEVVRAQRGLIMKFLTGLIVEAQASGLVSAEIKADLAANFFFGASNWVYTWFTSSNKYDAEQVGDACARQWLASIGTGESALHDAPLS